MARPKKETLEHKRAFDLYLSMGADRSTARVAQQTGKCKASIDGWSSAFGWVERVIEAEKRIADRVSAKNEESLVEYNAKLLNVADGVMGLFVKRMKAAIDEEGNLKPRGYKPSALDAKIWSDVKRDILEKATGSDDTIDGVKLDARAAEELGFERIERIVIERITRLSAIRKRGDPRSWIK